MNVEKLFRTATYPTVRVNSTPDGNTHWLYMHADARSGVRPCFRPELMEEMWTFLTTITRPENQHRPGQLRHVVLASDAQAFNLGGDLALFARLIQDGNRQMLLEYARRCIEGVYHINNGLGGDVRTIALLQGDALGGGLELALSCHTIVAEQGVEMGLPEVLFGLFPGMGAYSFLSRRISPRLAEKLILGGDMYTSQEMHRMGIVDVLVPKGEGEAAVEEIIRKEKRSAHAHLAMNSARAIAHPVSYDELMRITEVWVDTALSLGEKSLRTMTRLVRAQDRLATRAA